MFFFEQERLSRPARELFGFLFTEGCFAATGTAHGTAVLVTHAAEAMFGVGQAPAAEVYKQGHTSKGAEGEGENDQEFSNHEPKSSKWMFSRSTPRFSSMSSTALVIMGGPHI